MSTPQIRRAISLLPELATTGVGSLPHTQLELGLQLALQQDIPFMPQLPVGTPSELMIPAALDGMPGLSYDAEGVCTVDVPTWRASRAALDIALEAALASPSPGVFEPSAQASRAWKPFLWEVEHRKLAFAKAQIAGPCTCRWVLKVSEPLEQSEAEALDRQVFRLIFAKSVAMVRALRDRGTSPIFFLDEPGLYALDRRNPRHLIALQEVRMLVVGLQREGALVGVHCCSNTVWGALLGLGLDFISLDVRLSLDALLEQRESALAFLASGASLSLGIIPTNLTQRFETRELVESVEASLMATLPPGPLVADVLRRTVLTPACGLAMRSVQDTERTFEQLKQARELLSQALKDARGGAPVPA